MDAQSTMLDVISEECKTIIHYKKLLEESGCPSCHAVLKEIISDEFRHIGCALQIVEHNPETLELINDGKQEAIDAIHKEESQQLPPMI